MDRIEALGLIYAEFDRSAREYRDTTGALDCVIDSILGGTDKIPDLKYRTAELSYGSYTVVFKYNGRAPAGAAYSILECHVKLGDIMIPLPFLVDHFGIDCAEALVIPFISDADGMKRAFGIICRVLSSVTGKVREAAVDPGKRDALIGYFLDEIAYFFEAYDRETGEIDHEEVRELIHSAPAYLLLTIRFTSKPFILHMKGKDDKAVKALSKVKRPTGYEKRMTALWAKDEGRCTPPGGDLDCVNDSGMPKSDAREILSVFIPAFLFTVPLSALYLGFYFLLYSVEKRGAFCLLGPTLNFPVCFLAAFITAIAVSYFTRNRAYRLLFPKHYEKYEKVDRIMNGGFEDRFMRVLLIIVVAASLIGCALYERNNVRFADDGFTDNTAFWSLRGEFHEYADIDCAKYLTEHTDGNNTFEGKSYALVLKDGTLIDLFFFDQYEDYKDSLPAFLAEHGVKIENNG